ncbi:adenylate cyclase [Sphaerisporangium siamense]|uniref:Putative NAD(P)/FAD-binding protein YdhS n=1 Tax=Sphaerisporangium siamense TaxID=795645 RepID=A0A7W7D2H4_9ACTN|nr:FAD/NAD(P)-binding protein [Sphaerisporangium siamense]MBB4698779.1 putative NAD(P)/FAD-binding protein YdhS [Sphaerisporangium siamense]GII89117.1 adenylate cyclase [Sphaerisporangium siamense]
MGSEPLTIVVVGAGPGGTVMVERLIANAPPGRPLEIHVVDPHPPGGGRTWRRAQSELMWMNSQAVDVSLFTDASVRIDGPIRPGPAIYEWAAEHGHDVTPATFTPRVIQNAYLSWCFAHIVTSAPPEVTVHVHQATAESLTEADGRQRVRLDDGSEPLDADAVLLVQGYLDAAPGGIHRELADFAAAHGLVYIPPNYVADVDLDVIPAGEPMILRGMGLGFIDTMVLLAQGRGGHFEPRPGGGYVYHPSGAEPIMYVGSRRGVPNQSKITYTDLGSPLPAPRYFVPETLTALHDRHGPLDLYRHLWPLIAKELGHFYYHELFTTHPDRVTLPWQDFLHRYDKTAWNADEHFTKPPEGPLQNNDGSPLMTESAPVTEAVVVAEAALVAEAVPNPEDRLDLATLLSPLEGLRFDAPEDLQQWLRSYIITNVARHADPAHSADLALFKGMLVMLGLILDVINRGLLSARSHAEELMEWFQIVFSYYASGPPPQRLLELEALSRAGIVHFLGGGITVTADRESGLFRAHGTQIPGHVEARTLIESRLPTASITRAQDPLLRTLYDSGAITEEILTAQDGTPYPLGRLRVENNRLVNASGKPHPRRFALGHWVGRGFTITGFARPSTNALPFRTADALARQILTELTHPTIPTGSPRSLLVQTIGDPT